MSFEMFGKWVLKIEGAVTLLVLEWVGTRAIKEREREIQGKQEVVK